MTAHYSRDFFLSWDEFQYETKNLIRVLREKNVKFDRILAVTRGGLFPAGIVARELGILMIDTVGVSSYYPTANGDMAKSDEILLLKKHGADFEDNVLVIDDLTDTGSTMNFLRPILPRAHFAALFVKPKGVSAVDTYSREVAQNTWVRFPWDTERAYVEPMGATRVVKQAN